jgi:GntR family transcriptional regulator
MDRNPVVIDSASIVPLYKQLIQYLISAIETHQLKPGDRIPSESELSKKFNISRVTVRRALQELAYQEKIVSVPGKGSFLRGPKVEPLTALTSFSENMRASGHIPSYSNTQVSLVEPSLNVAAVLHLQAGERALHIHRLMLADGQPMAIQDAYLPYYIYKYNSLLFKPEVLDNTSMYRVMEIEIGIKLFRAEEQVEAAIANPNEAKDLDISEGEVVLISTRTTYDLDQKPVEYVKLIFPASRYRYKVELFRPSKPES